MVLGGVFQPMVVPMTALEGKEGLVTKAVSGGLHLAHLSSLCKTVSRPLKLIRIRDMSLLLTYCASSTLQKHAVTLMQCCRQFN